MGSRPQQPTPPRGEGPAVVERGATRIRPAFGFSNTADHDLVERRIGTTNGIFGLILLAVFALASIAHLIVAPSPAEVHAEHLAASLFALVVPLRGALVPTPPSWTV